MNFFVIIPGIFFAILAAAILSYISMATMVGPWIAPAVVLASSIILRLRRKIVDKSQVNKELAIIQTVGSVGGIIGVGIGFSLPTLYFLDSNLFNNLISNPLKFSFFIAFLCIASGGLGIWIARVLANKFILKDELSFPVSKLIHKMITSQTQARQAKTMFWGFSFAWVISFLRDGLLKFTGFLPKVFYVFPSILGRNLGLSIMPMLWAIGFITGIGIVLPLFIGMLSKYLILWPLNNHSLYLPFKLFPVLPSGAFVMAFASGLAVSELILGLMKYPGIIWDKIKNFSGFNYFKKVKSLDVKNINFKKRIKFLLNLEFILVLSFSFAFLTYLKFSFASQILLLIFIVLATYQISFLAAKLGLVTFGRFATFIMIPMMMMFKLGALQITMICVFFNVCAAVASDLLFDYKVGQLCSVEFKKIHRYQWLGLIVTSLTIGFFLWLLFTNFQVGSPELFAQRGKSRALLIQSLSFDWRIVFFGFFYGVILKKIKISPTMVFGGILMPNDLTIGLAIGATISYFTKNSAEKMPFWSGVFAGESIWILFFILMKLFF
ncbi:MAG: OPT/YSL family transporter [bacterium]